MFHILLWIWLTSLICCAAFKWNLNSPFCREGRSSREERTDISASLGVEVCSTREFSVPFQINFKVEIVWYTALQWLFLFSWFARMFCLNAKLKIKDWDTAACSIWWCLQAWILKNMHITRGFQIQEQRQWYVDNFVHKILSSFCVHFC